MAAASVPAQTVTVEDAKAKDKIAAMQEQLEANYRAMFEMKKFWEDKLA